MAWTEWLKLQQLGFMLKVKHFSRPNLCLGIFINKKKKMERTTGIDLNFINDSDEKSNLLFHL